ncbi:MAG TPA: MHYT domain-containing protein [Devosia sp.]
MLTGHYEAPLVMLSVLVAIFASYTALMLAERVRGSRGMVLPWIAGGAFAMGTGIWGMHFIGMLAFRLPIALGYDLGITLASWLLPIAVSAVALRQLGRERLSPSQLARSGALLGIGINAMHYVGMAAMRMNPPIAYDPALVAASVVIAVAAATAALWIVFRLRVSASPRVHLYRAAAAVVMGFAIVGMHYTGMTAANFPRDSVCRAAAGQFTTAQLSALVVLGTVAVLAVALLTAIYDAQLQARTTVLTMSQETARERQKLLESEQALRLEAERLNTLKDEFLATLSHELRTPLNAILGWAHVLRTRRDEAMVEKAVQTIERNARLQARLIDDLLDMSRIVSGRVRIEPQVIQAQPVVEAAVEAARPAALFKQIDLVTDIDPSCGSVWADAARLQQVMWNLLTNATKFTPAHGKVSVTLRCEDDQLLIEVQDTGIGISPDFLPHAFERFRQADASTTRIHGGLGLGLAICHQLVTLHGGTIGASSEGVGKGTTVSVRLPLAKSEGTQAVRPASAPDPESRERVAALHSLAGLKVLVIDDQADARELLEGVLAGHGAEVETAASAHEALDVMVSRVPDVLVSDIGMPGVDGFELIRRVRGNADERLANLKAVALTAFARADDEAKALASGFNAFFRKPVEVADLVSHLARIQVPANHRTAGQRSPATGAV